VTRCIAIHTDLVTHYYYFNKTKKNNHQTNATRRVEFAREAAEIRLGEIELWCTWPHGRSLALLLSLETHELTISLGPQFR
jgi:hypothetical protein